MGRDDGTRGHNHVTGQALDDFTQVTPLAMLADLRDLDIDGVRDGKDRSAALDSIEAGREDLFGFLTRRMASPCLGERNPVIEVEVDKLRRSQRQPKRVRPLVRY